VTVCGDCETFGKVEEATAMLLRRLQNKSVNETKSVTQMCGVRQQCGSDSKTDMSIMEVQDALHKQLY
jgi:hypothetical protein